MSRFYFAIVDATDSDTALDAGIILASDWLSGERTGYRCDHEHALGRRMFPLFEKVSVRIEKT